MNEEHTYQLIHAVDPTKINVPIREKFAKLTLSSHKKKNQEVTITPKKQQMEKRQSASRNLMESLSNQEYNSSLSSKTNPDDSYKNPLLRSDSSETEDLNSNDMETIKRPDERRLYPNLQNLFPTQSGRETICKSLENSVNDNDDEDNMEPLQVSIGLTQEQEEAAKEEEITFKCLNQQLSALKVEYPKIVLSSTEDLYENQDNGKDNNLAMKKEQNITICVSTDETESSCVSEDEVIVLESSVDEQDDDDAQNVTKDVSNLSNQNQSFIPPTAETIEPELLESTKIVDKDERILAFLKDVSFENRQNAHKYKANFANKPEEEEETQGFHNKQYKAKEIAQADTEPMTTDQESLDAFISKETSEREQRLMALEDTNSMHSSTISADEEHSAMNDDHDAKANKKQTKRLPSMDTEENSFVSAEADRSEPVHSEYDEKLLKTPIICRSSTSLSGFDKKLDPEETPTHALRKTFQHSLTLLTPMNRRSTIDMNITNDSTESEESAYPIRNPPDLRTPVNRRATIVMNTTNESLDNDAEPSAQQEPYNASPDRNAENFIATSIARRSTVINTEQFTINEFSSNNMKNMDTVIGSKTPLVTNVIYIPAANQAPVSNVSISRRSTVISNEEEYYDGETPISRRSTIVSDITEFSLKGMNRPNITKSTLQTDITKDMTFNDTKATKCPLQDQTTFVSEISNESGHLDISHKYNLSVIESDISNESIQTSSIKQDESLFIPETASENESESDTSNITGNIIPSEEALSSNQQSSIPSQMSQLQMGIANINISAKINIRIQISHVDTESETSEDDNDEATSRPSLPPSTESNSSKTSSVEEESHLVQQRHQKVNLVEHNSPNQKSNQIEAPVAHNNLQNNSIIQSNPASPAQETSSRSEPEDASIAEVTGQMESLRVSPCKDESQSDDEQSGEQFMTHARKLLDQLYGKTWKTPVVIRTLKRTSEKMEKSSEKINKTKTPVSAKLSTPNQQTTPNTATPFSDKSKSKTSAKLEDSSNKQSRSAKTSTSKKNDSKTEENLNTNSKSKSNINEFLTPHRNASFETKNAPCKKLFSSDSPAVQSKAESNKPEVQLQKENQPPSREKPINEESILDDFSFFRSNIKANLDSTRMPSPPSRMKKPLTPCQEEVFKMPQSEPKPKRRINKPTQLHTPSNVAIVTKTRSGRQITQRWRQLVDNDTDSDSDNASDDPDADCTAREQRGNKLDFDTDDDGDNSWKASKSEDSTNSDSDFEEDRKSNGRVGRRNLSKTRNQRTNEASKGTAKRITNSNTSGDGIIYLDLSQEEVSIVEKSPNQSPPANRDKNFANNLEEILKTCRRVEKPKLEATPKPPGSSKRKLFNPNFGFEDECQPPESPITKTKEYQELVEDLPINLFNKQIESIKAGEPIFKVTPPRSKDTKTPLKSPAVSSTSKKIVTPSSNGSSDSDAMRTPKTATKVKGNPSKKIVEELNWPSFKYNFLKSLDVCVGKTLCHPEALVYRDNYSKKKEELANRLYDMYNEKLFNNELKVPLVWNKKLSNTAGRCLNKKKLGVRTSVVELSEKVLTSPDRLRCTLIHELCHAATWIFNGEGGHGATWKAWARKANEVFPEIPKIGVCHQYDIEYKYTYKCVLCGAKSHAHSKSKKVENIRCAYCHGAIEIFLNKKDKEGNTIAMPVKEPTGFAKFVKDNYKKYKNPNLKHADVMKILSTEFAALKVNS